MSSNDESEQSSRIVPGKKRLLTGKDSRGRPAGKKSKPGSLKPGPKKQVDLVQPQNTAVNKII